MEETQVNETSCYTYEVTMIVQVLAMGRENADEKLEREGGFVSKRNVVFKDVVPVYSGIDDSSNQNVKE